MAVYGLGCHPQNIIWTEANSENFKDPRDVMRSRIPQTRDMQHTQYNSKEKKKQQQQQKKWPTY